MLKYGGIFCHKFKNQGHNWDAKFYHAPELGKLRSNSRGDAAICRPSNFFVCLFDLGFDQMSALQTAMDQQAK